MAAKIRRNLMLKSLDIKEPPIGTQISFSIIFIKKDGERVFVPRAVSTVLPYSLSAALHQDYYPLPAWYSAYRTGWIVIANQVPIFLKS
jgi:hypothetical protein